MADQATEKGEVTVPIVDAQEASAAETKTAVEETAPKADAETSEDVKPDGGMSLKPKQFAHRALPSIPAIFCELLFRVAIGYSEWRALSCVEFALTTCDPRNRNCRKPRENRRERDRKAQRR